MPYISSKDRQRFSDEGLDRLLGEIDSHGISNGDLNYIYSRLAKAYIDKHGLSYNTGSDVIKAFECAKMEFYARVMRPYEDTKIKENGDVY